MAERRMFAKRIIDSDAFTELPPTTQALYFHLCMGADDDGFNNQIRRGMFNAHADRNDFDLLVQKRFIIPFDSGVIVIKHWRMHNLIKNDRYKHTAYIDEMSAIVLKENGVYTESGTQMEPKWNPNGTQMEPQVRLGKDSIGKDSIGYLSNTNVLDCPSGDGRFSEIVETWNSLSVFGVAQVKRIVDGSIRAKQLKSRISQYGEDAIIEAIDRIRRSKFLQGDNNRGWIITFDWFIKPSNFAKVYEGNYDNTAPKQADNKYTQKLVDIGEWVRISEPSCVRFRRHIRETISSRMNTVSISGTQDCRIYRISH